MTDHLQLAAAFAERSEEIGHQPTALLKAQLAQAYALIALVERLDRMTVEDPYSDTKNLLLVQLTDAPCTE